MEMWNIQQSLPHRCERCRAPAYQPWCESCKKFEIKKRVRFVLWVDNPWIDETDGWEDWN